MIPPRAIAEARKRILLHAQGAEADAGFDAGEFSGPAHHESLEHEINNIAKHFNVDADELWYRASESEDEYPCHACGGQFCTGACVR